MTFVLAFTKVKRQMATQPGLDCLKTIWPTFSIVDVSNNFLEVEVYHVPGATLAWV